MSSHSEEGGYPKIVGNMLVESRDAVSGYRLRCSCQHLFMYEPCGGGSNAIEIQNHLGDIKTKAMCPDCKCLWFEDAELKPRTDLLNFATFVVPKSAEDVSDMDMDLVGLGRAYTQTDAMAMAVHSLREKRIPLRFFIVKFLDDKEYEEYKRYMASKSALEGASFLGALLGIDVGDMMKEAFGGSKHREKRDSPLRPDEPSPSV